MKKALGFIAALVVAFMFGLWFSSNYKFTLAQTRGQFGSSDYTTQSQPAVILSESDYGATVMPIVTFTEGDERQQALDELATRGAQAGMPPLQPRQTYDNVTNINPALTVREQELYGIRYLEDGTAVTVTPTR